jgi:hypothetical protein
MPADRRWSPRPARAAGVPVFCWLVAMPHRGGGLYPQRPERRMVQALGRQLAVERRPGDGNAAGTRRSASCPRWASPLQDLGRLAGWSRVTRPGTRATPCERLRLQPRSRAIIQGVPHKGYCSFERTPMELDIRSIAQSPMYSARLSPLH